MQYGKIILIAIDTLSVDHLGCYGYDVPETPTTPFLDSLAESGVIFRRHYATDVPTPPSFTSLFCGNRGIRHGILGFKNKASEYNCRTPILAECFSKKGFRTGMISNLLYPCPWLTKGFKDIYPPGGRFQGGTAEEVTDKAISMLKNYYEDDFLLFVHHWEPHVPYMRRSKAEYRKMFPAEEYRESSPDMKYLEENSFLKRFYDRVREKNGDPLDPGDTLALYDANIRYADDYVEKLYNELEELGIADETLIVITSDHGEAFGEYGFWDHWSSYRNISQLPLIFAGPDIKHAEVQDYTQNIDVLPTLLELADIKVPKGLDGKSMVPLLDGEQNGFRSEVVVNSDGTVVQRMFVKDEYALVYTPARPVWDHIKEYELFNLPEDPDQTNDISREEKDKTSKMRIMLRDWEAENLNGKPDPLWLCVYRGGWMWESLCRLLEPSELTATLRKYPELRRILTTTVQVSKVSLQKRLSTPFFKPRKSGRTG